MDKSPDAFRTISEVAEALETPAHVLRFWESRFPQIKPVKRAGGRRYYRPVDVALLSGIRHLLHDEGMTIRGVQKILREQGVRHVAALAPGGDVSAFEAMADDEGLALNLSVSGEDPVESAQVLPLEPVARRVAVLPDMPADVVPLHGAAQQSAPDLGFMLPTANRRPLPTLDDVPLDADVPEAAHVWVEDDEPRIEDVELLFPVEATIRELVDHEAPFAEGPGFAVQAERQDLVSQDSAEDAPLVPQAVQHNLDPATRPNLAGLASRLRALPRPVSAQVVGPLAELQMRLGLLHAQMTEAARLRR